MTTRVCHHCEKAFIESERQIFIPIEKPYMNLIVHEECFKIVNPNLIEYLTTNLERCYNLFIKGGK